ncbi:hypothetical protein HYH02_011084 [Chlamydomonas schloesseri]|uniref:BACK domain-containing protein n=1 Tax=Chlamydomonas schloesseri TaxID=2026947 RepID=A0A835TG85_9CHLO|nr:hypothetical protein HYH02_011084 [Chlamydomonas schloesseri]|eukprot:KAG2437706.1 hypothetical protein HYH02_011084 [Chlamydomonas schloesseri]
MAEPVVGNADVMAHWAKMFGQDEDADCKVVLMLESSPPGGAGEPSGTAPEGSGPDEPDAPDAPGRVVAVLPAHSWVLRPACEKWNDQWLKWTARPDSDAHPSSKRRKLSSDQAVAVTITVAAGSGTGPSSAELVAAHTNQKEIRIDVRCRAEVPSALAVVEYAYTGQVKPGSVTEAIQIWRQADYLQMKGCMAACLELVKKKLAEEKRAAAAGASGSSAGGSTGSSAGAAIEFFQSYAAWPDAATNPSHQSFMPLLAEAKRQLVAHFGDTLAVLNKKELYDQMLALPAVGLEALLESDDFGTDSESSVVLLLAEWIDANYGRTDAATRRRLCGLLRLCQCSRAYLDWVLPALALDHLLHPDTQAGWFPITPAQLTGCVSRYLAASDDEKAALERFMRKPGALTGAACLNVTPRRQCVPAAGLTYTFSAGRAELVKAFAGLRGGNESALWAHLRVGTRDTCLYAQGLAWCVSTSVKHGSSMAGLWLNVNVPRMYCEVAGTAPATSVSTLMRTPFPTAWLSSRMCVHMWAPAGDAADADAADADGNQWPQECSVRLTSKGIGEMGRSRGRREVLQLAAVPIAQPPLQMQTAQQALEAAVAAQWARYLKDDRLTGTITILPEGCR